MPVYTSLCVCVCVCGSVSLVQKTVNHSVSWEMFAASGVKTIHNQISLVSKTIGLFHLFPAAALQKLRRNINKYNGKAQELIHSFIFNTSLIGFLDSWLAPTARVADVTQVHKTLRCYLHLIPKHNTIWIRETQGFGWVGVNNQRATFKSNQDHTKGAELMLRLNCV